MGKWGGTYMTRCLAAVIEESSLLREKSPPPLLLLVAVVLVVAALWRVEVEAAVDAELRWEKRPCFSWTMGAGRGSSFLERRPIFCCFAGRRGEAVDVKRLGEGIIEG